MKTRPGIERITKQTLQAAISAASADLEGHIKLCYHCQSAGTDVYGRCLTWWRSAKALHRARREMERYEAEVAQPQLDLGLDDE